MFLERFLFYLKIVLAITAFFSRIDAIIYLGRYLGLSQLFC